MKLKLFSLVMALVGIFLGICPAWAQPAVEWQTPFGGQDEETSSRVVRDGQGNTYVLGQAYGENTYADILVVKHNPQGQVVWSQQFDTGLENDEYGFDIKVDAVGNVYVAGVAHVGFYYEDVDLLLVKYDTAGNLAWFRTYDGPEHTYDAGFAVALDPAGNPVVAGSTQVTTQLYGLEYPQDEFLTVKFDVNGTPLWTRTYAGPFGDGGRATAIATDTEGNVIVSGGASIYAEYGGYDLMTLKYAPDGTALWTAQYESRSSYIIDPEYGLSGPASQILTDAQNNVYVLGTTSLESHEMGYDSDVVVLKYGANGTQQWKQVWGTRGEENAGNMVVDSTGNVYVAADSRPFNPRGYFDDMDASVFAVGADGALLWNWTFNGPDNGADGNTQVVLDGAGQPYAAFYTQTAESYDMGVVKFGQDGATEWLYRYDSPRRYDDVFTSVVSDGSDGLIFSLWSVGFAYPDLITLKMRTSGGAGSPPVLSLSFDPTRIKPAYSEFGASPVVTGTVTLSQPAPEGGAVVKLSGSDPALDLPPFVIISAGQTEVTFEAGVNGVDETHDVTVSASGGGGSANAAVTVVAGDLTEFLLFSEEVIGGDNDSTTDASTFGQITLDAFAGPSGGIVQLTSSNPAIASVPESLEIGYNDTVNYFAVKTSSVSEPTQVVISATYRGVTLQKTLTVLPARVAYVTLFDANFSNYLPGGVPVTGRVYLEGTAPAGGLVVTLVSNDPHLIVPATVTVPEGARNADFVAQTLPTSEYALDVTVTATSGDSEATGYLTLHLPILREVRLNPEAVAGGAASTGTVVIDGPAPEGGYVVSLDSDNAAASVPAQIVIPAGATSADFPITTAAVEQAVRAKIHAFAFGGATAFLAVVPAGEIPDTVTISSVGYSSSRRKPNRLGVLATSTSTVATLRVYNADTNALIGTLTHIGNGQYSGSFYVAPKPARVIVRSSLGGSATAAVP